MEEGKPRRLRMSAEERTEALARLTCKTGKLDDREVDELRLLWPEVCRTHTQAVFGKLARHVSTTDAGDLAQEVLADGFWAFCEKGAPDSLRNLLLTIADRKVFHLARYKARHPVSGPLSSGSETPMSSSSLADRILARREDAALIMSMLSPDHQDVIRLVVIENMKHADAAAALNIPEGTLKSRLLAAKRALHEAAEQLMASSKPSSR